MTLEIFVYGHKTKKIALWLFTSVDWNIALDL